MKLEVLSKIEGVCLGDSETAVDSYVDRYILEINGKRYGSYFLHFCFQPQTDTGMSSEITLNNVKSGEIRKLSKSLNLLADAIEEEQERIAHLNKTIEELGVPNASETMDI